MAATILGLGVEMGGFFKMAKGLKPSEREEKHRKKALELKKKDADKADAFALKHSIVSKKPKQQTSGLCL